MRERVCGRSRINIVPLNNQNVQILGWRKILLANLKLCWRDFLDAIHAEADQVFGAAFVDHQPEILDRAFPVGTR